MDIEWRAGAAIQKEAFRRAIKFPLLRVRLDESRGIRHFKVDFEDDDLLSREDDIVETVEGYEFEVVMDRITHHRLENAKLVVGPDGGLKIVMEDEKADPDELHVEG